MGKRLTGGYKIIPFGIDLLVLATSGEEILVADVYEKIKSTKKRIVLSGLKINGELQNDISVKVDENEDDDLIINDVYGYDIRITSESLVLVIEHVAPAGGSKLYKHDLVINAYDDEHELTTVEYTLISLISENLSRTNLTIDELFIMLSNKNHIKLAVNREDNCSVIVSIVKTTEALELGYIGGASIVSDALYPDISITDTVTEL